MSDYKFIDIEEERVDIYRKLKDGCNVLASIMYDERENVVYRIRAAKALSETAKALRRYILDEEKYNELKKKIKEIEKQIGKRNSGERVRR